MLKRRRNLQAVLDREDLVPDDVPHWIVEYHDEHDERHLTPLQAAQLSAKDIHKGHRWCVHHVRSGLEWSVSLSAGEAIEITDDYWKNEAFNWSEIKEAVHA